MALLSYFNSVSQAMLQIFLLGLAGFVLVRKKILSSEGVTGLSSFLIGVAFPALIFWQLVTKFSFSLYPDWWIFPCLSFIITGLGLSVGFLFSLSAKDTQLRREFISLVGFQNAGYLPLTLLAWIAPKEYQDILLIYLFLFLLGFNLVIWSWGIYFLSVRKPEGSGAASDSRSHKPEGSGAASDSRSHKPEGSGAASDSRSHKPEGSGAASDSRSHKPEGSGAASDSRSHKPEGSGAASDSRSHRLKTFSLASLFSPPVIAVFTGLAFVALKLNGFMPKFILQPIELLGNCSFPLAVVVVGATLAELCSHKPFEKKLISKLILAKLIVLPTLGLLLVSSFRLPYLLGLLIIMELAVPSANSLAVIARKYSEEGKLISQGIFISHLVSLVTLPVFLALFHWIALR